MEHGTTAARRSTLAFRDGAMAPLRGLGWVVSTPSAWPLAIVPVVVFTALVAGGGYLGVRLVESLLAPRLTQAEGWSLLWYVARAVGWLAALASAVLVALALAQPLSGPALEALAQKHARALGAAPFPVTSAVAGFLRSLRVTLFGLLLTIPVVAVLTVIGVLVPPLAVVTVPLKFLASALMVAWDLLDYPLSLRGRGVRARLGWFRANFAAVLGFGVSTAALGLIPCAGLLFLPAGVVGATALVLREAGAHATPRLE